LKNIYNLNKTEKYLKIKLNKYIYEKKNFNKNNKN
jgi:hypothetical protein